MATHSKEAGSKVGMDLTGQREFSTRLMLELAQKEGNLFVSPFSAWCLLALLHPGARGETREMLEEVLGVGEEEVTDGVVDRPYWFFIRDEHSGIMLFAGRVEDPS